MNNTILNVYRGTVVENSHQGHIAVVDVNGNLMYSFGDPYRITHGRSALKPFQVLPVIETGTANKFGFTDADIALSASSHSGEAMHQERVQDILRTIGLSAESLRCGVSPPLDWHTYERMLKAHEPITPLCNECSGVHAAMLATAVFLGEDTSDYTEESHPVQQRVKDAVLALTGLANQDVITATDGCGIPTYCMPLRHIAWAFARLSTPEKLQDRYRQPVQQVIQAYLRHPEMVTDEKTYSTRVMRAFGQRLLLKEGSQGVFGMADLESGIGVAIKIEDGRKDELPPILLELLRQLEIGTDGLLDTLGIQSNTELENTNLNVVGEFKAEFRLKKHA